MYELRFEGNAQGRERYEICWQAAMATNKPPTKDNEDDFIDLIRAIKKIGTFSGQYLGQSGIKLYDLQDDGGTLFLEKSVYKLLIACLAETGWRPPVLEQKRECEDWLKSLTEVSGSLAADARPEEKRRAEAHIAGSIEARSNGGGANAESPSAVGSA